MGGYVPLSQLGAILLRMILRVWAYSGLVVIVCILLYYLYGGLFAVLLLFVAVSGGFFVLFLVLCLNRALQVYYIKFKTVYCTLRSCRAILAYTFPYLQCLGFHSRVLTINVPMGSPYTCILYINQRRDSDWPPLLCFSTVTLATWGTGRVYLVITLKGTKTYWYMVFLFAHLFRLQNCSGLYHNLHCNILLVEYRGYGLSEGTPSEEGLYTDAKSSLDYLFTRNDINHSEIVVFGRSLGKSR